MRACVMIARLPKALVYQGYNNGVTLSRREILLHRSNMILTC